MNFAYLIIGISGIWCFSEILLGLVKRSPRNLGNSLDKSSLRILWAVIVFSVLCGVMLGVRKIGFIGVIGPWISITGIILILFGLIIRWIAILTLKKYFTVDVAVQGGQKLFTSGIYKYIRHPSYTGSLISFLGLGMSFSNWILILVIPFPIFIAFYYRITIEEKALIGAFKEEYEIYRKKTKMLIPYIF